MYNWRWTNVPIILEIIFRLFSFFWFRSSSSIFQARAVWSFWVLELMPLAIMMICRTFISHIYVLFAFKIFLLPVPTRPGTRTFLQVPNPSHPEVKNPYPSDPAAHPYNPVHHQRLLYFLRRLASTNWILSSFFLLVIKTFSPTSNILYPFSNSLTCVLGRIMESTEQRLKTDHGQ